MRIGIVTQPLYNNYGGIIQNWALQRVLLEEGQDPITIDYLPKQSRLRRFLSYIKETFLLLFGNKERSLKYELKRNIECESFVALNIKRTDVCYSYNKEILSRYGIDMVCIGSDQVWRPDYNGYTLYDMYGRFSYPVPTFTYAASFGVGEWEYNRTQTIHCRKLVRRLKGVSVREKPAVGMCRDYLKVDAKFVLDPTLLVTKDKYESLIQNIPAINESFILAYVLDSNEENDQMITRVSNMLKLNVHRFSIYDKQGLSIEEWLREFRDAAYIITDSYHGVVFSVIFKKIFKLLPNNHRGMLRFQSLLEACGLEYKLKEGMEIMPIDWGLVDESINEYRKESYDYLHSMLNSIHD